MRNEVREGGQMAKGECCSVKVTCWNCRGLKNGVLYLNTLTDKSYRSI